MAYFCLKLKIFFNYCSLMNLLFIDLIAMFMSHKQWTGARLKKKNAEQSKCRRQRGLTKRTLRPIAKFDLSRWLVTLRLHLKNNPKKKEKKKPIFHFLCLPRLPKLKIQQFSLSLSPKAQAFLGAVGSNRRGSSRSDISSPFIWSSLHSILIDPLDQRCRWPLRLSTFSTSVAMFSSIASIATMSGIYSLLRMMLNLMGIIMYKNIPQFWECDTSMWQAFVAN